MNKYAFLLVSFLWLSLLGAQSNLSAKLTNIDDGPFIFIEENSLIEKSIIDGQVRTRELPKNAFPTKFRTHRSTFKNVEKIAALSDIHGQYDLTVEILKNNKLIDEKLNWSFGEGHLVIVGDVFDRGDRTTDLLWLIYKLEKQALAAGGKVHYLLGNHEVMVMQGDLRYIHKKDSVASALLQTPFHNLYGRATVLGRWLRSKPTVIKINDHLFVHGGISSEFLNQPFNRKRINEIITEGIDIINDSLQPPSTYYDYFGDSGPIWYRGYFYDNLEQEEINKITKKTNSKQIIVGHCSNKEVVSLFNDTIFGVDSSIKNGLNGEILFIENGKFSRGLRNGTRTDFKKSK